MTNEQFEHLRRMLDTNSVPAPDDSKSGPKNESRREDVHAREISLGSVLRDRTDYGPII